MLLSVMHSLQTLQSQSLGAPWLPLLQILVVTRLIPEAQGTTCNQRIEKINGTNHARCASISLWPAWLSNLVCTCALLRANSTFWSAAAHAEQPHPQSR